MRLTWQGSLGALSALALGVSLLVAMAVLWMVMHLPAPPLKPVVLAPVAPAPPVDNANGFVSDGEWHTQEYWLSILDNSASEQDYKYLLDALQAKFPGITRHQIGDYLVRGQEMLREKGIKESLSEFGWHVDECVPKSMAGTMKFPEVAAIYLTLRVGQR